MVCLRIPLSGCVLLLLLLVTAVDQSRAQATPTLSATGLIPSTPPGKAYFAEGESTATLLLALPACSILFQAGSFLELYNVDTGFVAGRHGPFDNRPMIGIGASTTVGWNTTTYPVLNAGFTGLYMCRTDTGNSMVTYQLNVRAALNVTCPADFRIEENETLTKVFHVPASLPSTITNTPKFGNLSETSITSPTNVTWLVPWSDPALLLGENVTVAWNFSYVDGMCSGVTNQPSVLTYCTAVSTGTCTINVLKVRNCTFVSYSGVNVSVPYTSAPGHILNNAACKMGYNTNDQPLVRDVVCQLDGNWTAFPDCEDIDECQDSNTCRVGSSCTNTNGSFICSCAMGSNYNYTIGRCVDPRCQGPCVDNANCVNGTGGFKCECRDGYFGFGQFDGGYCAEFFPCVGNDDVTYCPDKNSNCKMVQGIIVCDCNEDFGRSAQLNNIAFISFSSETSFTGFPNNTVFGRFPNMSGIYQIANESDVCIPNTIPSIRTEVIVSVTLASGAVICVVLLVLWKKNQKGTPEQVDGTEMGKHGQPLPEPGDDDLKPTFKSGQRLVRPGGVGYGDGYCPADEGPGHMPAGQCALDGSAGIQDPSTLPGTSEVPIEDNYNTFIRSDRITNPPPTSAPTLPTGRDTYDHIVLGNLRSTAANSSDNYDHVDTTPASSSDVYQMVDKSKKSARLRDDSKN